jgi:hypothetical protein
MFIDAPMQLEVAPIVGLTRGLIAAAECREALKALVAQYEKAAEQMRTERTARYEPR